MDHVGSAFDYYFNSTARHESILVADNYQITEYNDEHPEAPLRILNQRILQFYDSTLFVARPQIAAMTESFFKQCSENGVITKTISKTIKIDKMKPPIEPNEPKVFTMQHLQVGFKIHAVFLFVALILFLLEFIMFRSRFIVKSIQGLVLEFVIERLV